MRLNPAGGNILVKIAGGKERAVIAKLNDIYKQYNPGLPFEFNFMDKDYEAMYISEERESILFRWFAGLAIIISCLGLYGLAAFAAQKLQPQKLLTWVKNCPGFCGTIYEGPGRKPCLRAR